VGGQCYSPMHYKLPTPAVFSHGGDPVPSIPSETRNHRGWEYLLRTGGTRGNHPDCTEVQPIDQQNGRLRKEGSFEADPETLDGRGRRESLGMGREKRDLHGERWVRREDT